MKRSELLFTAALICVVPPILYLMSGNTRYEANEITCVNKNSVFKLSYESLSTNESLTFENETMQAQLQISDVTTNSFSFSNDTKTYKINLDADNALVIEDGVNEIFECDHKVFKM